MRNTLTYLVDRFVHQRSRADSLLRLRERLAARSRYHPLTGEARALVDRMLQLREEILSATGRVTACATCAVGCELPNGRWDGGFCCGGKTEALFNDAELAALFASGTRPSDLRAPHSDHAGCVFRGPSGCSLRPRHRPNVCVGYVCRDLAAELSGRGDLAHIDALSEELRLVFKRFAQLHTDGENTEILEGWSSERT